MPIVIKDFEWKENAGWVFIVLDIKGVRSANTDLVSSPTYLKLHCSPFIFEVFLSNEVEDTLSECTIDENSGKVSLRLKKASAGLSWKHLENSGLTREEKAEKRSEALQITHERSEKEKSEKLKRQFDRKQSTVHDQIKLDALAKEEINKVKAFESEQALIDFNELALTSSSEQKNPIIEHDKKNGSGNKIPFLEPTKIKNSNKTRSPSTQIFELSEADETDSVAIRPPACISVSFTPREFPTPSRESKLIEEQEWLKKQAEARRLCGFVDEDLRPEERNPQWLLDKGISLMKAGSLLGAISAFSLGIRLAPKMPELYVERGGAHLAIKNYHKSVEDCSQALEMLTPKVKANEEDRLKCHRTRGTAFCGLAMWEEALADCDQAIELNPKNKELSIVREEILSLRDEHEKTHSETEVKDSGNLQETRGISEKERDVEGED